MIPSREALTQMVLLDTRPANTHNFSCFSVCIYVGLLDCVNDDDIVHHDDDPGTAADDEDDCDHDQDNGQTLFTFTKMFN